MVRRRTVAALAGALAAACLAPVEAEARPGAGAWPGPAEIRVTELGGPDVGFFPVTVNLRGQVMGLAGDTVSLYEGGRFTVVSPPRPGPAFRIQSAVLNQLGDVGGTWQVPAFPGMPTAADARPFLWSQGFVDIGRTDGAVVDDVNDRRQVLFAGYPFTASGAAPEWVWDDGEVVDAPVPEGFTQTNFVALNNAGLAVGTVTDVFFWRAAVWQVGGEVTVLGTLGGTQSFATGITESGTVVGRSFDAGGQRRAFVWRDGTMRDLGTLGGSFADVTGFNQLGHVIGVSTTASGELRGYLWRDGRMTDLGPARDFHPSSVNVWGQVVGCNFDPALGRNQMFLWQNGHRVELTALAGGGNVANCGGTGINDRGQVVASVRDASGASRGVLWTVPVLWGHLQP